MTGWWERQIQRADHLAARSTGSRELLVFYAHLLRAQREIYEFLRSRKCWLPSGDLQRDMSSIRDALPGFLKAVEDFGPEILAAEAHDLSGASTDVTNEMLMNYWLSPSDVQFFAKAFLQPYARWLVETGAEPLGR